jgi:hypothetical protein
LANKIKAAPDSARRTPRRIPAKEPERKPKRPGRNYHIKTPTAIVDNPVKAKHWSPMMSGKGKVGPRGTIAVRRWGDGSGAVRVSKRTVDLMEHPEQIADWTDEELARGAPKHVKRPPNMIPAPVFAELVKRVLGKARHRMAAELMVAVEQHIAIITDVRTEDRDKLRAIEMLYDRVLGKQTDTVILAAAGADEPWRKMMDVAIVSTMEQAKELPPGDGSGEVVEGEIVEAEWESEDDDG